jgi:hypothetical protein
MSNALGLGTFNVRILAGVRTADRSSVHRAPCEVIPDTILSGIFAEVQTAIRQMWFNIQNASHVKERLCLSP